MESAIANWGDLSKKNILCDYIEMFSSIQL